MILEGWAGECLPSVPQSMATAEADATSGGAVDQSGPGQNCPPRFDDSTSLRRPLGWCDLPRADAVAYTAPVEVGGSWHGGHEPVQRTPWVESHSGLLEDTANRSEYPPGSGDSHRRNDQEAIQHLINELSAVPHEPSPRCVQPNAAKSCSRRPEPTRSRKPAKGPNNLSKKWKEEETSVLLKSLAEGGRTGKRTDGATHWARISQDIRTQCGTVRSDDECRRRYDTLLKAFKRIEKTGKPLCNISKRELREMTLATPLSEEWYEAIGRIQRSSENTKRGKRAKVNASAGTGVLSFSPPAPGIPSGRPRPEEPTQKQKSVPEFKSLDDDLRSTLLNLVQASSMRRWFNESDRWDWRMEAIEDLPELEAICERLEIVQDRSARQIFSYVRELSELGLVTIQLQTKTDFNVCIYPEVVPCLNLLNLRVYKRFVEKVLCKNPHLNTHLQVREGSALASFPEVPVLSSLQRIRVLSLRGCVALRHADLSNFRELRCLSICYCENLQGITGWEAVKELGWLELRRCNSYGGYPPVHCLPSLREFYFDIEPPDLDLAVQDTWAPDFSECVRLRRLMIDYCLGSLELDVMGMRTLRFLEVLSFRFMITPTILQGLSGLHALTHLDLSGCESLRRVPELGCCKALTHLDLSNSGVEEIAGVQELQLLTALFLARCWSLKAVPCLGHLKALAHLDTSFSSVEEIPGVHDLVSLEMLSCVGSRLKRLPDLHHLPRLQVVLIWNTPLSRESDPTSCYFGKSHLVFSSRGERTVGIINDISDISDTE